MLVLRQSTLILNYEKDGFQNLVPKIFNRNRKNHISHKKKSKTFQIFFIIVLVVLFCLIIFNVSDLISSLITQEKSIFYKDKIETTSFTTYAVSINDYASQKEAENNSSTVKALGGMGRVYESGEFYLIVAIYPTLIEAGEIRDNLKNLGYNSKILNISVKEVFYDYEKGDKEIIVNSINIFRNTFLDLYDLVLKFDNDELSRRELDSNLATLCARITNVRESFLNNKNALSDNINSVLSSSLSSLYDTLNSCLYLVETDKLEYSAHLKGVMLDIVFLSRDISDAFNK